jgi:xylan 1,4-beta-xylosidase
MMANGLIPKPTLWAFAFFANLKGECVLRNEHAVIVRREDGGYEAVLWNLCRENEAEDLELSLVFPVDGDAAALVDLVDEETCNPLACWHRMGEPADLTAEQLDFLRAAGQPARTVLTPEKHGEGAGVTLNLAPNALVRLRVVPVTASSDPGYDYSWYCKE